MFYRPSQVAELSGRSRRYERNKRTDKFAYVVRQVRFMNACELMQQHKHF